MGPTIDNKLKLIDYRIVVDARPLAHPGTGNATYLYRMLRALIKLYPQSNWILISHKGIHTTFADILLDANIEVIIYNDFASKLGPLWLHLKVPGILKELDADVFWATLATLPYQYKNRTRVPAILNFHDLNAFVAPKTMRLWNRWQHKLSNHASAKQADIVMCLSQTTRNDLLWYFPDLDQKKLRVVYPGYEQQNSTLTIKRPTQLAADFRDFFLCVGTIEPRKNQQMLVEAYIQARNNNSLPALLFVGRKGWGSQDLYNQLKSKSLEKHNIFFLENASNAQVLWCYKNCVATIMASQHEGFGLPVLEANSYHKPVLLADIPIFTEIGKGNLFVTQNDTVSWVKLLQKAGRLHKAGTLMAPPFDSKAWSHASKAAMIGAILNEAIQSACPKTG